MGLLCAGLFYETNLEFPYISGAVVSIVGLIVCIIWMRVGNRKAGRKDTDYQDTPMSIRKPTPILSFTILSWG